MMMCTRTLFDDQMLPASTRLQTLQSVSLRLQTLHIAQVLPSV